jgi:glutamine cyclotransferase
MSNKYILIVLIVSVFLFSCGDKSGKTNSANSSFNSPESGQLLKSGDSINIYLAYADGLVDSIQYFVDTIKLATKTDTTGYQLNSSDLPLGSRLITAKIYRKGVLEEVTSNIVLVSSKIPVQYGYKIIKSFPHSTKVYTEGLEYHDGYLYESAGDYGHSALLKLTLGGKVVQKQTLGDKYFGEGITIVEDKIIQLTYKEKIGFEFDKNTFKLIKTFPYNHANEGWGLYFNGDIIYNTDGSNRIFMLDKNTYQSKGFLEVYDDKGAVTQLNELELIQGKLYANIYTSELIAIIDPKTGAVEAYLNMMGLPHAPVLDPSQDVLNGIAYDKKGKRIFVTGKKWDKLFQIEIVKQ